MLAKMTSKNQLTLPKRIVQALGDARYFDIELRDGQVVLTPVRIQRGDAVRAKLTALGLSEADVADALRWARDATVPGTAQPAARYGVAGSARRAKPKRKAARRT